MQQPPPGALAVGGGWLSMFRYPARRGRGAPARVALGGDGFAFPSGMVYTWGTPQGGEAPGRVPKEDTMNALLAEFAALVIDGSSSVDRSAKAHELLDAGMSKAEVIAFEFAIMDAHQAAIN